MRSIIIFLFALGIFLIIHSIYDQKFQALKKNVRVEYRFIPRTYYEEQLAQAPESSLFKNMFDKESPWFDRTVTLPKAQKD
jgi:hypothetical protein